MRAWLLDRPGPPSSLRLAEVDSPWRAPAHTRRDVEVLVQVEAVGLNPVDFTTAAVGHPAWRYPHVLGLDVAGRVVAVHAEAAARSEQGWMLPEPGTRVVFHQDLREPGGFAEFVSVRPEALARIPPEIDPIAAASMPTAGLTALDAVERRLRQISGHTVLVHGAGGGVGSFAVQLAKLFGARVIGAARPQDEARVRALGALHVVDHRAEDFAEQVLALAPEGLDAIIDTVSARSATEGLRLLRHAGHLVAIAGRPDLSTVPAFGLAPTVSEVALGAAYTHGGLAGRRWLVWGLERLMRLTIEGHLHPPALEVIAFDEIPLGLERLAARKVRGKVVANLRWG
ncbi:MAG: zinc-binding dehydrogenase [Candidatus Nanopelagicales bacterium]|jgi:NADPH:quinone reductase-like Zn-dependent oxidoreductase|nr:zinc-binding dehydrogenase [Candidatus Nanopelagicales bacterium]